MYMIRRAAELVDAFNFRTTGKWFILATLIGCVAGTGAILFQWLGQFVHHIALERAAGWSPVEPVGEHALFHSAPAELIPWMIVVVMTLGGLLSGWLVYTFAPEAEGHGTDAAIDAYHHRKGMIRGRVPLIKTVASAITLGTGGSGGREGPIAQIGAGFGSYLATRLQLAPHDRRILLAAGLGAGVGAIFRAPLAGALFAGEILYRDADLESEVIVPSAMASIVGYSVYSLSLPSELRFMPLFGRGHNWSMGSLWEMLPYSGLALLLTVVGVVYIKTFHGVHQLFQRLPIRPHFRPAIGAGTAGLVGVGLFYAVGGQDSALAVLGTGYGALQAAITPGTDAIISVRLLLLIAAFKILTTALTISSGGSGGVFGPSMVIGGCVGAAVGWCFHDWWPDLVQQPATFALVGMAGFFAGCARAPLSTILMVTEMTGDYRLLLPTLWVSTLCFLFGQRWTLYSSQVHSRVDSPAHRGDFIVDVLEGISVGEVFGRSPKITSVAESMSLDGIVHLVASTRQSLFPVIDENEHVVGYFSADDVRAYFYDDTIWQLANARDVMDSNFLTVHPHDDLNTAMRRFTSQNIDELPVVDSSDPSKLTRSLGAPGRYRRLQPTMDGTQARRPGRRTIVNGLSRHCFPVCHSLPGNWSGATFALRTLPRKETREKIVTKYWQRSGVRVSVRIERCQWS